MAEIVILEKRRSSHHVKPLINHFGERAIVEPDWRPEAIMIHDPDLVIAFEESFCERGLCIANMARHQIATLQIMDGILEWRNTWTRARSSVHRPLNQPVLAHKVACLGRADARILESWGNVGKCEIVGSPRFDHLLEMGRSMRLEPITNRAMRLLVMTAKTPGHTNEQVEITFQSLVDLRDYLTQRDDIQVIWRVTKGLHKRLGVRNTLKTITGLELHQILAHVDAVITTPSTVMLEAMLFGHPVALLDYHNCPHYVPAAWRIIHKEHIPIVMESFFHPPLERMLYQDFCMHDALSCRSPALPRMVTLIEEMIHIKRKHDAGEMKEFVFPHRILDQPDEYVSWPSENFDLRELYPDHNVFARQDLGEMQAELEAALGTINLMKNRVDILTRRLHRIPGYKLLRAVVKRLQQLRA